MTVSQKPLRVRKLTPEHIFREALRFLALHGLEALNMRALATHLQVKAASLYHHVPNKDALLEGIQTLVFAEIPLVSLQVPWQEHLTQLAQAWHDTLRRHPQTIVLFASRPSTFSSAVAQASQSLDLLIQAGFSPALALYLYQSVAVFVLGHALAAYDPHHIDHAHAKQLPADTHPALRTEHAHTETWFHAGIAWLIQGAAVDLPGSNPTLSTGARHDQRTA